PWAASFTGAIDLPERLARFARRHAARPLTRCGAGLARGEGRSVLVVLGTRRRLTLERFPSRLAPGDRQRLEGRLLDGYRAPSMVVATPRGDVVVEPALQRSGRFGAGLGFPSTGRYVVEVMATGPRGPEVVALFPVFAGTDPDDLSDPPHERSEARDGDAAAVVLELLNAERRRAGLPVLEVDDELVRLAAEHSADMLEGGWFGHVSPTGTDVVERLRRAGIVTLRAAENLARTVRNLRPPTGTCYGWRVLLILMEKRTGFQPLSRPGLLLQLITLPVMVVPLVTGHGMKPAVLKAIGVMP
ncbi:MAG: CAP domain-containing protein, partial [Bacteroidales bacterium]